MSKKIGKVLSSSPSVITVEISSLEIFEENKIHLLVGKYIKIADGNHNYVVCVIHNLRIVNYDVETDLKVNIDCQPIGIISDRKFIRGGNTLPVPTEPIFILNEGELDLIFKGSEEFDFALGVLGQNNKIEVKINGDNFFSKHVAIVGSTGSGKSNAVAKILQNAVGIQDGSNLNSNNKKNSHILIFDIHSEYKSAFSLEKEQKFVLNNLSVNNLKLPYWLMNSEELESLFIESSENNSHNQVSVFKQAVTLNKQKYNRNLKEVNYDTPVYFSIKEVFNFIENMNREVISKINGENCPKLLNGVLITSREEKYFEDLYEFVPQSNSKDSKASNGPFYGEFNRFSSRLETKLSDNRLRFLLEPKKENGSDYGTDDFEGILRQFLGYINKSNVSIVDLSGIPFEVLSITISLISRLIFDFCFNYSKLQHEASLLNEIPVMIVCEEAHNYVPRSESANYKASRKSLERIAKEGRKYGLSLMVVSQRPSEVSETIFAQCNNFVSLRLTNQRDQNYIKNLMPDSTRSITGILPNLTPGECLVVGDSIIMPSVVKLDRPNPEPKSQSVRFNQEWNKEWKDIAFNDVIKRWKKEVE